MEAFGASGDGSGADGGEGSSSNGGAGDEGHHKLHQSIQPQLPIQLTQSLEVLLSKGNYVHCPNPKCKFVFEKLPPTPRRKNDVVLVSYFILVLRY